jgi:hypothetical protein
MERAIAYTVDFIRIIGMPTVFKETTANLIVSNYRAALPCNFHEMI